MKKLHPTEKTVKLHPVDLPENLFKKFKKKAKAKRKKLSQVVREAIERFVSENAA